MIAQYDGNIGIGEGPAEPIGAEQQDVARHKMVPSFFESEPVLGPHQVGDDIGERMVRGGFGSDFTAVEEVLDIAVIMADLPQPAGPQQVTPAVAGPQAATASAGDQHNDNSAADHGPRPDIGGLCP